jgi:hypothetical protein
MRIKLRPDSLYYGGREFLRNTTEPLLLKNPIKYKPTEQDLYHIVTFYDSYDILAFKYYGNSKYWWVIAEANEAVNPFELEPGTSIVIPNLSNFQANYQK